MGGKGSLLARCYFCNFGLPLELDYTFPFYLKFCMNVRKLYNLKIMSWKPWTLLSGWFLIHVLQECCVCIVTSSQHYLRPWTLHIKHLNLLDSKQVEGHCPLVKELWHGIIIHPCISFTLAMSSELIFPDNLKQS